MYNIVKELCKFDKFIDLSESESKSRYLFYWKNSSFLYLGYIYLRKFMN